MQTLEREIESAKIKFGNMELLGKPEEQIKSLEKQIEKMEKHWKNIGGRYDI